MTSRSLRHRLASRLDGARLVRARRVPPGRERMIHVTAETTTGGNRISQSFLIKDGQRATFYLRGYAQTADGFSYLTVPVVVEARVT